MALSPSEEIIVADETNTTTTTSTTTTQPAAASAKHASPDSDAPEGAVGTESGPEADASSPTGKPVAKASKVESDAGEPEPAVDADGNERIAYEPQVDGTGNAEAERVAELYRSTVNEETGAMLGAASYRADGQHERLGRVGEPHFANPDTKQAEHLPANQRTTVEKSGLVAPPSVDRTPAKAAAKDNQGSNE